MAASKRTRIYNCKGGTFVGLRLTLATAGVLVLRGVSEVFLLSTLKTIVS